MRRDSNISRENVLQYLTSVYPRHALGELEAKRLLYLAFAVDWLTVLKTDYNPASEWYYKKGEGLIASYSDKSADLPAEIQSIVNHLVRQTVQKSNSDFYRTMAGLYPLLMMSGEGFIDFEDLATRWHGREK